MTPKQIIAEIMDRVVPRPGHNMLASEIIKKLSAAGYQIVPIKPTEEMLDELARIGDGPMISGGEVWGYMLAAATAHPTPADVAKDASPTPQNQTGG